jgi:hypothetical protein
MKTKIIISFCFVFFLVAFSFLNTNVANAGSATINHEVLYAQVMRIMTVTCYFCGGDGSGSGCNSCPDESAVASYTHDYPLGSVKKVTKVNVWGQSNENRDGGFDLGIKLLKGGSVVATRSSLEYARSDPAPRWAGSAADPSTTAVDFGGIEADTIRVFITNLNEGGWWSNVWYEYLPSAVNLTSGSCPSPGSTATLRWNASSGATSYELRIDDTTTGTNDDPCGAGSSGDSCPTVNGTSYSFTSTPGHSYRFWAHACDSTGCNWAVSTPSQVSFTCVVPSYSCTGSVPSNATMYASDNTGLSANTPYTYANPNTAVKCQYSCNSGYNWSGSSCVCSPSAPTFTCVSNPAVCDASNCNADGTNTCMKSDGCTIAADLNSNCSSCPATFKCPSCPSDNNWREVAP